MGILCACFLTYSAESRSLKKNADQLFKWVYRLPSVLFILHKYMSSYTYTYIFAKIMKS